MALTDLAIKALKPDTKPRKHSDGGGLYLLVQPTGSKLWRLKYRYGGKERLLAFGQYPDVPLKLARTWRDEARTLLAQGIDPGAQRKAERAKAEASAANTFAVVAGEWFKGQQKKLAESTIVRLRARLDNDLLPQIGDMPIADIMAPDILRIVKRIAARGAYEVAGRVHSTASRIFRYAVAHGLCDRNPAADIALRDVLHDAPPVRHHPGLTDPKEVGALMRAIYTYRGTFVVRQAFRLTPLVFVRPGELRQARWSEIDLDRAEWRVPASTMKMRDAHIVPLSRQAVDILREVQAVTGDGVYVFPSARKGGGCMSREAIPKALQILGYTSDQQTAHGFRTTASTLLHENGFPSAVIERQLAHRERNKVAAAYNHAEHMPERREMVQWWADYLDQLKAGAQVIPMPRKA